MRPATAACALASPFFAFSAVVIRAENMHLLRAAKARINERLGRKPTTELHWSKNLQRHEQRVVAAEEVAALPARIIYVAIEKRSVPDGSYIATDHTAMYNWALRLLLERVSWLVDDAGGEVTVTLAQVEGLPKGIPLSYVERLRNGHTEIRWHAIRREIEMQQSSRRDGLQVMSSRSHRRSCAQCRRGQREGW